ncbi:MAG: hypothetical protein HQL49_13545 [Gammaproteobacteria bacterium]|nr:hypothetical protein [Gammaproteobacteria bacterium]
MSGWQDRWSLPAVIVFALVAVPMAVLLLPKPEVISSAPPPWEMRSDSAGNPQILGITLDISRLNEVEQLFIRPAEVNLFVTEALPATEATERLLLEAYFASVNVAGLQARVVLVLNADERELQAIYQRGARVSATAPGRRKVQLADADRRAVGDLTIASLTYMPSADISEDLLRQRFGEPAEILDEGASGNRHWLYPERGLSIVVNDDAKEVFQFLSPLRFTTWRDRLAAELKI